MRLALAFALACAAAHAAPLEVHVRHGFGGRWWPGVHPVTLEVQVSEGHVEGDLAFVSQSPRGPLRQVMALKVDGPARQVFRLVDPWGESPGGRPPVELDGRPVANAVDDTKHAGQVSQRFLVVAVGEAAGYPAAETAPAPPEMRDTEFAAAPALARELPETPFGYGITSLVVLRGREAAQLEPAQARALVEWVHLGGHLVVSPGVPPVPLRDVAWLEPLLPAATGAPRTVAAAEVERQLRARPAAASLDAVLLEPRPGTLPSSDGALPPLSCARRLGSGNIEMIAIDETALGASGLRTFLTTRLAGIPVGGRVFGEGFERELLRLVEAGWARSRDVLIAAGLMLWAVLLWFLARLPASGTRGAGARSPVRRMLFRPAVALVVALGFLARRPAPQPLKVEVAASLELAMGADYASGQALFAASGTAGQALVVPLPPGRTRVMGNSERRNGWRAFYATPYDYLARVAPAPALERLVPDDGLPLVLDLAVVAPAGGTWTAELRATGRASVDGWISNNTAWALESGYLLVDGAATPLPRIPPGGVCRGPFRVAHPTATPLPAGANEDIAGALPDLLAHVARRQNFPADGLTALPALSPAVVGHLAVPPAAYSPAVRRADTLGVCWLPIQERRVRP